MAERPRSLRAVAQLAGRVHPGGLPAPGQLLGALDPSSGRTLPARIALHLRPALIEDDADRSDDGTATRRRVLPGRARSRSGVPVGGGDDDDARRAAARRPGQVDPETLRQVARERAATSSADSPAYGELPERRSAARWHRRWSASAPTSSTASGRRGRPAPRARRPSPTSLRSGQHRGQRPDRRGGEVGNDRPRSRGDRRSTSRSSSRTSIHGTFDAIVTASIKQMDAYTELLKNVTKSRRRVHAATTCPRTTRATTWRRSTRTISQVDTSGDAPRLVPTPDANDGDDARLHEGPRPAAAGRRRSTRTPSSSSSSRPRASGWRSTGSTCSRRWC